MQTADSIIFNMLIAKSDAAKAYRKVVKNYVIAESGRTNDIFDTVTDYLTYDEIHKSVMIHGFSSHEITACIDELITKGKAEERLVEHITVLAVKPI